MWHDWALCAGTFGTVLTHWGAYRYASTGEEASRAKNAFVILPELVRDSTRKTDAATGVTTEIADFPPPSDFFKLIKPGAAFEKSIKRFRKQAKKDQTFGIGDAMWRAGVQVSEKHQNHFRHIMVPGGPPSMGHSFRLIRFLEADLRRIAA